MRYWVYINNKVDGPYDETKLVTLNGFTQDTLICSEEVASNGGQEWVKASSIFEFDEVPVQEASAPAPQPVTTSHTPPAASTPSATESMLLAKLNALTEELSSLHQKLNSVQTGLDKALAQNERLSQQLISQSANRTQTLPGLLKDNEKRENTITLTSHTQKILAEQSTEKALEGKESSFYKQADPKEEEELVIRSALDSIYGEKPLEQKPAEDETFQDLLSKKEAEKIEEIGKELTFTLVEENQKNKDTVSDSVVKEALITTPSAEEISRDELINELTASPKEDILDQIIQERKEQKNDSLHSPEKKEDGESSSTNVAAAGIAGAAAAAGLAAGIAAINNDEKSAGIQDSKESFSIATDKNNPTQLEQVLPTDQMPADVPAAVPNDEKPADAQPSLASLPTMDDNIMPGANPQPGLGEQISESEAPSEETIQELVPGATLEKKHPEKVDEGIYEKPYNEIPTGANPSSENTLNKLTDKDFEDAFGPKEETISATITTETTDSQNPNDLTEIELKEGSTYLISDFVPPAQVGDEAAEINTVTSAFNRSMNKQQETIIQDMLAVTNKTEKTQNLSTKGLPEDAEATRISLENTIKAKRGAALDIKTAPMVPEPADSPRLDLGDLDDVNAQHDIKTSSPGMKLTKMVIGALVGLLLLIVLYVVLGMMNLLPQSINLFSKKKTPTPSAVTQEFLQDNAEQLPQADDTYYEEANDEVLDGQVLSSVQNFALPNDMTLKQLVQSKHPTISESLISWEVADAIEPDNYAITIKVPPENPQNFKTVYRFNYNADNGLLEPTISDAKNLLDQVYGTQA